MRLDCKIFVGIRRSNGECNLGKWSSGYLGLSQSNSLSEDKKNFVLQIKHHNNRLLNRIIKINQNSIQTLLTKHIKLGKATILLNHPSINIFVSEANSTKLRCFMTSIQQILEKNTLDETFMLKNYDKNKSCNQLQKLHIYDCKEYMSLNGFSQSLCELRINEIGLKTVDFRWFRLNSLKILDLSKNYLGLMSTVKEWRKFENINKLINLEELNLSENKFVGFPDIFYEALPISLRSLNLSNNQIVMLSERISRLKNLQTLLLNYNNLTELPEDLCLLKNLRFFCTSDNQLQCIPGAFFCRKNFRRFVRLDLSGNILLTKIQKRRRLLGYKDVPSLCQITASVLINNLNENSCIYLKSDLLPLTVRSHMRKWLRRCSTCINLFPRFENCVDCSKFLTIQMGNFADLYSGPTTINIEYFFCKNCFF